MTETHTQAKGINRKALPPMHYADRADDMLNYVTFAAPAPVFIAFSVAIRHFVGGAINTMLRMRSR